MHSPQISIQNSATAKKPKTNVVDDEGFIHPAKASKSNASNSKITPNINIEKKFETLSKMSDADMINYTITLPLEPKMQQICMKMAENFIEIISSL